VVGLEDMCGRSFAGVDFVLIWDVPLTPADARLATSALEYATSNMIKFYMAYVEGTPQRLICKWLHDGLDCLTTWNAAQDPIAAEYQKQVLDMAKKAAGKGGSQWEDDLRGINQKCQSAIEAQLKKQEKNRDHLLELASCRPHFADQAVNRMQSSDEETPLDIYVNRVLEQCGCIVDLKQGPRRSNAKRNPDAHLTFEAMPKEGMDLVFSRKVACTREADTMVSWDHELVGQATTRLLSTSTGNTAYVVWEDDRAQIVLLEGIFVLDPLPSAPDLQVSRYMPPTPVRVVLSHEQEELSSVYTTELVNKNVRNGRREWLRNNARPLHNLIPPMLRAVSQRADTRGQELSQKAASQMELVFQAEIARLEKLGKSTRRTAEIQRLQAQMAELKRVILGATLRLDSLRLLRRGPSGKGI
jgi:ATP-dependent helicase HepA